MTLHHRPLLLVGLATVAAALLRPTASSGDSAPAGPTPPPQLAAQIAAHDQVRLYVDFVEIAGKLGPDERPRITVEVEGQAPWSQLLDGPISVFRLGPVIAPPQSRFAISVWRQHGDDQHIIAKVGFRDPGGGVIKKSFAEGALTKLSLVVVPVDVWELPELAVVSPGPLTDPSRKLLTATLVDFADRLADISDGQIRIAQFAVYEPPLPPGVSATRPGVIRLADAATGCGDQRGRPGHPAVMTLHLDPQATPAQLGAVLVHQFGHAYFGLEDESSADGAGCPGPDPDGPAARLCFMSPPEIAGRYACRGADHDPSRFPDHRDDCWHHMTQLLAEDVGLTLLGDATFVGPVGPPPAIRFSAEPVVDLGSQGQPLDGTAIDPVIAAHGDALGRCLVGSGQTTATVKFAIRGVDGRVVRAEVDGKTSGPLASCVATVMLEMHFPTTTSTTRAEIQLSR